MNVYLLIYSGIIINVLNFVSMLFLRLGFFKSSLFCLLIFHLYVDNQFIFCNFIYLMVQFYL